MTFMRRVVNVLPRQVSEVPIAIKHYIFDYKNINANVHKVSAYEKEYIANGNYDVGEKAFFRNLKMYCLYSNLAGADKYLDSYFEGKQLKLIKQSYFDNIPQDEVILICCVFNDLDRIKRVYEHHKRIGINYMVFVDNMSDDGTKEWLKSKDVDLYEIDERYHAGRKAAWIRKIQDIYGYRRWYLIVDSDELFSFVGDETHSVGELVEYVNKLGIKRVKSMLLDMYSDHEAYKNTKLISDMEDEYCFFDSDTYYEARDFRGEMIRGGPRPRVFSYGKNYDNPLTKYPLIFAEKEDIWADHTPMPFSKNFGSPMVSVLRHYKFMEGDLKKYKKAAKSGNYYGNSLEYRTYVSYKDTLKFFYEGSKEYKSSRSLQRIPFIHGVWEKDDV